MSRSSHRFRGGEQLATSLCCCFTMLSHRCLAKSGHRSDKRVKLLRERLTALAFPCQF